MKKVLFLAVYMFIVNMGIVGWLYFSFIAVQSQVSLGQPYKVYVLMALLILIIGAFINTYMGHVVRQEIVLWSKARRRVGNMILMPTGIIVENNNGHILAYTTKDISQDAVLRTCERMLVI